MHFSHFTKELVGVHVWRQTQTQSTINAFVNEDFNILNPKVNERGNGDGVFRMEFPLMQWTAACFYKLIGNHIIISRLYMFVIGLLSVLGIYVLINTLYNNKKIAFAGAWAFNFSPCFFYYTINPLPDNMALCVGIWGLAVFFYWIKKQKTHLLFIAGMFFSISALCKLPFIIYAVPPFVYFIKNIVAQNNIKIQLLHSITIFAPLLLPLTWYITVIPHWGGNGVILGLMANQIDFYTFFDYVQHHIVSAFPELIINYASLPFFVIGIFYFFKNKSYKNTLFPIIASLLIAVLVYFFFELNMIAKVHEYYLFPFFPIVFIIVSYGILQLIKSTNKFANAFAYIALFLLPFTAYLRTYNSWNYDSPGFNKDLLIYKNELRQAVPDDALCIVGNDKSRHIFFYYINKKGWGFDSDEMNSEQLNTFINYGGAQYLFSDSRIFEQKTNVSPYLDKLILEKGTIRIYSFKKDAH
jgi:hypothetical protein